MIFSIKNLTGLNKYFLLNSIWEAAWTVSSVELCSTGENCKAGKKYRDISERLVLCFVLYLVHTTFVKILGAFVFLIPETVMLVTYKGLSHKDVVLLVLLFNNHLWISP